MYDVIIFQYYRFLVQIFLQSFRNICHSKLVFMLYMYDENFSSTLKKITNDSKQVECFMMHRATIFYTSYTFFCMRKVHIVLKIFRKLINSKLVFIVYYWWFFLKFEEKSPTFKRMLIIYHYHHYYMHVYGKNFSKTF